MAVGADEADGVVLALALALPLLQHHSTLHHSRSTTADASHHSRSITSQQKHHPLPSPSCQNTGVNVGGMVQELTISRPKRNVR